MAGKGSVTMKVLPAPGVLRNVAAHQPRQAARDLQAQARAAMAARGWPSCANSVKKTPETRRSVGLGRMTRSAVQLTMW